MKLLIVLMIFTLNTFACELYSINGRFVIDKNAPFGKVLVYEKTRSQIEMKVEKKEDLSRLSSFLNQTVSFKAKVRRPFDGTKGSFTEPFDIMLIPISPLNMGNGIKKIGPCSN
jgi:hypothetical protein